MFLLRRSKAASAPASNGNKRQFSKEELIKATGNLQTALNKIANQHVLKYANAIRANAKAQANAVRANAVAAEAPTPTNLKNAAVATNIAANAQQNMKKTEEAAAAVVNAVPQSESVPVAVKIAEAAAVNNVSNLIANIAKYNTRENLNKVKNNQRYKNAKNNNKARINEAVNSRKLELITPIV
jgi:hypothetical protein